MSGMLSTVAVASRSEYNTESAGAISSLALQMAQPTSRTLATSSSIDNVTRNPGIDSSLSSVPPVCPRLLPEIIGTSSPQAEAKGATTSDALTCSYSGWWDEDGDADSGTTYSWTINGSDASTGTTLSTGYVGGDTVACSVKEARMVGARRKRGSFISTS